MYGLKTVFGDIVPGQYEETEYFNEKQIRANIMQREALGALGQLRERGEKKAILISATGSGKTFLIS